jgi:hypothetical protein
MITALWSTESLEAPYPPIFSWMNFGDYAARRSGDSASQRQKVPERLITIVARYEIWIIHWRTFFVTLRMRISHVYTKLGADGEAWQTPDDSGQALQR